jgi:hypothetical protein
MGLLHECGVLGELDDLAGQAARCERRRERGSGGWRESVSQSVSQSVNNKTPT